MTAPLNPHDLLPNTEYEKVREERRARAMALKDQRRISVGENITLLFENRETLMYQIQEIMRAEKLEKPEDLAKEAEIYNNLLPTKGELSACLFIEVTQQEKIRPIMDSMVGLDHGERVAITFADHRIPAQFEEGRSKEDRISAVQYIRFHFSSEALSALASAQEVKVVVDHPNYQAQVVVPASLRSQWMLDLMGK